MALKISLCLALVVTLTSSNEYSGLLSRLYQKASNANRPLILVLDNSLKDAGDTPRASKPSRLSLENDNDKPLNLMELFNNKHHSSRHEHKHQPHLNLPADNRDVESRYQDRDQPEPSSSQSVLQRLRNRLQKERELRREKKMRQDRRERRERRERDRKIRAQDRNDVEENDRDFYQQDKRGDRNQDKNRNLLQITDQDQNKDSQSNNQKRALRSSVIKNLLRTFNDLNCDAKEECQDECKQSNGKKKNACDDKCEEKYECEESEPEDDPCAEKGDCDDSDDDFVSTRGERLVTVTAKCKRC